MYLRDIFLAEIFPIYNSRYFIRLQYGFYSSQIFLNDFFPKRVYDVITLRNTTETKTKGGQKNVRVQR